MALERSNIGLDLSRILSPERIFILSFAGVILAGAITLYLPLSSRKGLSFRAIAIIFAAAFSVFPITSTLLLAEAENRQPLQSRHFFVEYLFEAMSAFGTVKLTMGVTPMLNDLQKPAMILIMFAGRVGPLTLAF